jgi:hypothetical protein
MKFFYVHVLGRIVLPAYFIGAALVSLVRPRAGAELLKTIEMGRAVRDKLDSSCRP